MTIAQWDQITEQWRPLFHAIDVASESLYDAYTDAIWTNDPTDWLTALIAQTPQQAELGEAVQDARDSLAQIRDDLGTRLAQARKLAVHGPE